MAAAQTMMMAAITKQHTHFFIHLHPQSEAEA
jgi:hypothetical protein